MRKVTDSDLAEVGSALTDFKPQLERVMRYLNLEHPEDALSLLLVTADRAIRKRQGLSEAGEVNRRGADHGLFG